jgi:hypothetical protein
MSSGGRAIGDSDRDRKPKLLAITRAVLENRVQTPVNDPWSACEGNDKIAAIVN